MKHDIHVSLLLHDLKGKMSFEMFSKHEAIICGKGRRQSTFTLLHVKKYRPAFMTATITEAAAFKAIHANANI